MKRPRLPRVERALFALLPYWWRERRGRVVRRLLLADDAVEPLRTDVYVALPGYFETLGIRLLSRRVPDPALGSGDPVEVVVDERFEQTVFSGGAVGRRVDGWGLDGAVIVGVVGHVKHYGATRPSRETLWISHAQRPYLRMTLAVRTTGDPLALVPTVRSLVADLDPALPIHGVYTLDEMAGWSSADLRSAATLGLVLAALPTALALVGPHAVLAQVVHLRRREFGVRLRAG